MKNLFKEDEESEPKNNQTIIKLTPILESLDKLQKIAEEPKEVSNFDEVKLHLRTELKVLYDNLAKMFGGLKIPDSFKIEGIPAYPDKVSVTDMTIQVSQLKELLDSIGELRTVLSQIDFKPKIEVIQDYPDINIPPIKIPEIRIPEIKVPTPEVTVNSEIDLSELLAALKPLRLLSDKAGKPLSVRLSDGERFIKALTDMVGKQEKWVTAFSASKGMDENEFANKFKQVTDALTQKVSITDIDLTLRRIVKLLEAGGTVDVRNRQIVTLGAIKTSETSSTPTEIAATIPVTVGTTAGTSLALGSQVPTAGPPYVALGTQVIQPIAETPVDQRWRVAEDSHISYQTGIRNHLAFV